jgi:putative transcriptional regulator
VVFKEKEFPVGSKKPLPPKHSALGRSLRAGLDWVAAHPSGEIKLKNYDALASYDVRVPEPVDVLRLRMRFGLSQAHFARAFGMEVGTVAGWEQGRRRPDRVACILLAVIAHDPEAVRRALAA